MKKNHARFKREIWSYYRRHGRRLLWRATRNPYRIAVSEIMLQQTQVSRVLQKYQEFITRFPDFEALARASQKEVLAAWQGLGYNRRALALKRLGGEVANQYKGRLPSDPEKLIRLSGIGKATAGSIAAFAFNKPVPFIETNIRRVYIHFFFPRARKVRDSQILQLVETTLDQQNPREWFWALMDYGAMRAAQTKNSNRRSRSYRRQPSFEGSFRQLRGKVLRVLLRSPMTTRQLSFHVAAAESNVRRAVEALINEDFLSVRGGRIAVK